MNKYFVLFVAAFLSNCVYGQTEIKKLSLLDAVKIGLKNNPEVKSARENISASKGRFWNGISLPQPEVSVNYEYVPVNSGFSSFGEKTIEVSQSFEFLTNYFLKGSKFTAEEEIAIQKLNMAERCVATQVKTSYYKILAKKYQINSTEENLKISEDFFKKAEIRQNVGEGTNLEKLTARVQFIEARNSLEVAQNGFKTALAEFNFALGFGNQNNYSNFDLADSLTFVDYEINFDKMSKSLEASNPEIKIAELNCDIASVDKTLAWSSLLPNFNVSYFRQTIGGNNGFYGASFGISVPLWFMLDQRGKIQEASANGSIFESELQLTKNVIFLKLKNAFTEYENSLTQVRLYNNEILPQAEEIYRTAIKSYDAGELTFLEFLQAKQMLINSQNSYISALYDYYQSAFLIEEITGQNIIDNSEGEK
ncbi:MAG: TolC family protein [Bacteroidetes bacterium]|nr:TolC family protein [Bacteroidota bacterium]